MSDWKLLHRLAMPAFSKWWFTHLRRMDSGDSFNRSSIRSPSCRRVARPGQFSRVIWLNKPIRMICQSRPRTKWGEPLVRSWASMFIILQPIAWAEDRASVKFSCFLYSVRFFLLIVRSSMVSGQEWLIILLKDKCEILIYNKLINFRIIYQSI